MSLPYDQCQNRFTSFTNFQKFINTKTVLCKCGAVISLGSIYQISNFQRHSQNYVNYIISSPASFGGDKRPEIIVKELFPEKFSENTSFTRKKLSNKEQKEFERALESEATWRLDKEIFTVKFTPHHYYNEPLLKLLKNPNLRQIWTSTNNNSDEEFWIKLAQFGLSGAFNGDSTFTELVALMVQIKEKKYQDEFVELILL
ncbi:15102_t:CDS:2 [Racocetra fulgida]|uniref:15102_t:CDS:1 n=1 Tax=Racocetra fulgida TaxID=60492 RepID=A0A9N9FF81_9GLOM|nr:15102_t:CDS:2 [Racocetra fulgida]